MTLPYIHLIVPVIILRLLRVDKRLVAILSPLALLPDLDIVTPLHRVLFHNVFFVVLAGFLTAFILKKHLPFSFKKILGAALFMSAAHLALDIDTYGSAYLYPFSEKLFALPGEAHVLLDPEIPITSWNDGQLHFVFWQFLLVGLAYFIILWEAFWWRKKPKRQQKMKSVSLG